MNKHKQYGFSVVLVILMVAVIGFVGFAGYKVLTDKGSETNMENDGSQQQNSQNAAQTQKQSTSSQKDETEPKFQNVGIGFDDILYDQNALREFKDKGLKGFYVFGDSLPGGRVNPNFEFSSVKKDAKVIAAFDGVITHITKQEENGTTDYEVFLQTSENSAWIVGYDHLINVAVKEGDQVKAGDFLGNPNVQNNGLARFEIQVNKQGSEDDTHVCPASLLADSVKDSVLNSLTAMMQKWESTSGLELYDISAQNPVGCIKLMMTPREAEGR